jgi:uncharacterized protein YndB with AHSA1/START domain
MIVLTQEKQVRASVEDVWDVISDHRGMHRWLVPGMRVRLDPEGDPVPNGTGAVRVIERFGYSGREEVLDFEPPQRMTYTLRSGFPIDDHLGEIRITDQDQGAQVRWTVRFAPRFPGTGWLIRIIVSHVLRSGLNRLPRLLEGRPAAGQS